MNIKKKFEFLIVVSLMATSTMMGQQITGMTKMDNGLKLQTKEGILKLMPMTDNSVRVLFSKDGNMTSHEFIYVQKVDAPKFDVTESRTDIILKLPNISVKANRKTGTLRFYDSEGKEILSEKTNGRVLTSSMAQTEPTYAIEQAFVSPADEHLYGTGQFQDGFLNIKDLPRRLTQVNTQIAVPFILSSRGYGLLWHNYGLTDFNPANQSVQLSLTDDLGKTETVEVTSTEGGKKKQRKDATFEGKFSVEKDGRYAFLFDVGASMSQKYDIQIDGKQVIKFSNRWLPPTTSWFTTLGKGEHTVKVTSNSTDHPTIYYRPSSNETVFRSPTSDGIDYTVFAGNADQVMDGYRTLTGRAPMLPDWAFGYVHSREKYHTQSELLENATEFRRRGIPIDMIVQDWQYWGKYGWNAMQFDEEKYPAPKTMTDSLHDMNMKLMVSVWAKVTPKSEVGKQLTAKGYYLPGTQWIDFFNPSARAFYWKNMSERLLPLGIDAWWQDATEPENDAVAGTKTYLGDGDKYRLTYPLFVTSTVYDGLRKDQPDKRPFILTRCAFLGQQRTGAVSWSGDVGSGWDALQRQIPAGLNFVSTGLPYWTLDAGGFFRPTAKQYKDSSYHECLIRWFQFVTFCSLQRIHGFRSDTEPWRYGETVENEIRRYIDLRYRLFPYIYSGVAQISFHNGNLIRPLVMDFASDAKALDQKYEFMFGPAILVNPVVIPNVSTWNVYLPKNGGGWYDFWTGAKAEGGQTVNADAPLSKIPLYVKAGSIVPMGSTKQYVAEKKDTVLELRVYPGQDAAFELYEDEGTNNNYEKGACSVIPMKWNDATRTLTIDDRKGRFPGMLVNRRFNVVVVGSNHGTGIEPSAKVDKFVNYSGGKITVKL
ncbi:MAG: TIM-barrel domain-containing protein [Prevotella sp.]|jgi:alpha-D-xyloside xylohydrolase